MAGSRGSREQHAESLLSTNKPLCPPGAGITTRTKKKQKSSARSELENKNIASVCNLAFPLESKQIFYWLWRPLTKQGETKIHLEFKTRACKNSHMTWVSKPSFEISNNVNSCGNMQPIDNWSSAGNKQTVLYLLHYSFDFYIL